tara:strand:- start:116 stop:301 length:186 start_codon:yes stop_codon:yes gene_type:complete
MINPWHGFSKQTTSEHPSNEKPLLASHKADPDDYFDTSMASRSNTRKNLHMNQALSGSGSN